MSGHTPGPWKWVAEVNFGSGLTYISVQPVTPDPETMRPLLMASKQHHVCRMTHTAAEHAIAMHLANARLIAAAPDLLAALQGLLKANDDVQLVLCDGPDVPGFDSSALGAAQTRVDEAEKVARAALAKVEAA